MSVTEYADEFHTLNDREEVEESEYIIVGRFKRGLSKAIQEILQLYTIHTISDVFETALQDATLISTNTAPPLPIFAPPAVSPSAFNYG